jgi:predicted metal-dependent HD superfamily phosphohydrolase
MSLLTPTTIALLTTLYTSPTRHYHSLSHVHSLLKLLAAHRAAFSDPDAVEAAIWFHDAVYDSRAKPPSNEAASADLAVKHLQDAGIEPARLERIRIMILATATHTLPTAEELGVVHVPGEGWGEIGEQVVRDAAMFLDMDLAILGADEREYDEYERGVRKEYDWVGEEGWRMGRVEVLRGFLERERIYHSDLFRDLFEEKARENLRRAVERLA